LNSFDTLVIVGIICNYVPKPKEEHSGFSIYIMLTPFQMFHENANIQSINNFLVSTIYHSYLSHQYPPSFTWYLSAIPVSVSFFIL